MRISVAEPKEESSVLWYGAGLFRLGSTWEDEKVQELTDKNKGDRKLDGTG